MDFSGCIERNRDVNIFDVLKYKFDVLNLLSHWLIRMMYLDSRAMLCHLVHHSLINHNFHFMYFSDLIGLNYISCLCVRKVLDVAWLIEFLSF